jgi:hypothetical protein
MQDRETRVAKRRRGVFNPLVDGSIPSRPTINA